VIVAALGAGVKTPGIGIAVTEYSFHDLSSFFLKIIPDNGISPGGAASLPEIAQYFAGVSAQGIEAEILFYRLAAKKIGADSPVRLKAKGLRPDAPKVNASFG
jgi:hypothetical protein